MHVFLSYPKSGRTWIRFMLNAYLCDNVGGDWKHVFEIEKHAANPRPVEWTHLNSAMVTQLPYWGIGQLDVGKAKTLPWLLLTRNFEDTLRSAYFQAANRVKVFQGTPQDFIRDPRFGVIKLVTFYNQWEQLRQTLPSVTCFAYEAFKADPAAEMTRLLEAIGLDVDAARLARVLDMSSFDRMKQISESPAYEGTVIAPMDKNDPASFKVRSGGERESVFTDEDKAFIQRVARDLFLAQDRPEYRFMFKDPA